MVTHWHICISGRFYAREAAYAYEGSCIPAKRLPVVGEATSAYSIIGTRVIGNPVSPLAHVIFSFLMVKFFGYHHCKMNMQSTLSR